MNLTLLFVILLLSACSTDVIFLDEAHFGLSARLSANGAPVAFSAGAQHSMTTWLPAEDAASSCGDGALGSLYAECEGQLGFGDPVALQHIIATGAAAEHLAAARGVPERRGAR